MSVVDALIAAIGAERVRTGDEIPARNCADASGIAPMAPLAVVMPRSVEEVSAALKICHAAGQRVVVQGGLTGLAGGATPQAGEIALSLERLSGIEEVDRDSGTLTALAGTPLQVVQQAAEAAGLMCGIDLGARGSCTIGGNVATNAGGNQVLRYGMTRKNVLGLEVVMADGTIVRSLNKMMKNNAGYDWTQPFIGSEGTLGVVTRVVLGLHPRPQEIRTAVLAVADTAAGLTALHRLGRDLPAGLLVFEAMWAEFYGIATTVFNVAAPVPRGHDLYLLVESPAAGDSFDEALSALIEEGIVQDAAVAQSARERAGMWALRESVYEYERRFGRMVNFDIAIPLSRMAEAVAALRAEVPLLDPKIWVVYGHLADSNLHVNVAPPVWSDAAGKEIEQTVYAITKRVGGSVSAEHGIGVIKRPYLAMTRTPPELALMGTLKKALDPEGILNSGRVL